MTHKFIALLAIMLTLGVVNAHGVAIASPLVGANAASSAIAARALGRAFSVNFRNDGLNRGRQSIGLSGPAGTVNIDQETGLVVQYTNADIVTGASGVPKLTAKEGQQIAVDFLDRLHVPHDGLWTLVENKYLDHGSAFREYSLTWWKTYHGVALPALINVEVDADTGKIIGYFLVDDPVTIPIQVNLTQQQAIQSVINKLKWQHPDVRAADLSIWYKGGYPGPQALLWRLEMANPDATTGKDSYVWADVDAATGEVYSLGQPGGFVKVNPGAKVQGQDVPKQALDLAAIQKDKPPPTVFQLAKLRAGKKAAGEKAK